MGKSCLENYCNRVMLCCGCPLEQANELGFLSIKVSLLVLLLFIFCCFFGICCNVVVFAYYNTLGTLHFAFMSVCHVFNFCC
jgi:hypothetical protein